MPDKNYKPAKYSVEIELAKSPDDVFDHLIDLSKWWPEEFEGESIKLNSEFIFRTGDSHYSKNKVVEFVPDKKLVWLATEGIRKTDNFEWTGTKMIFELHHRLIIPSSNLPLMFPLLRINLTDYFRYVILPLK